MASITTLKELLLDEIDSLYDAEKQMMLALPEMAKAAVHPGLRQGFAHHLEETKNHSARLEDVFERLSALPQGKTCQAMKGLVEAASDAIGLEAPDSIRDACLIGAAQRVEHYEIAAYGTARALAHILSEYEVVDLLDLTLSEEKTTDEKLTALARTWTPNKTSY